jgi:hypothetical protein
MRQARGVDHDQTRYYEESIYHGIQSQKYIMAHILLFNRARVVINTNNFVSFV